MNQPKNIEERLKELGWHDVTVREKATLQRQGAEGANDLHKAFEHAMMGIAYCYSDQEATAFLGQLEAHERYTEIQNNGNKLEYMLLKQKEGIQ